MSTSPTGRRERPGDPEGALLFHGGTVLTLDPERPEAEALVVVDDLVAALGSRADAEAALARVDRPPTAVDLDGGVLLPAFCDHHVHLLNVGESLLTGRREGRSLLDLSDAVSEDDAIARVAARAADQPPGSWVLGKGWNQELWGRRRMPTHHRLSEAVPNHPVYLARIDAHSAWVNLEALRRAGIAAATPDPAGGAIRRLEDGEPSGILVERACEAILREVPPPCDEEIVAAFRAAAEALARQGVTRVYDAGFLEVPSTVSLEADMERFLGLLARADSEAPLPLDVGLMVIAPTPLAEAVLAEPDRFRELSPRLRVTHIKLYADGAFGSRGAALSHPYADEPAVRGVERMTAAEIAEVSWRALEAGFDVAVHAIGDVAVGAVLDAYSEVLTRRPVAPRRLRLEHLSYASDHDLQCAADLGILVSVQPLFVEPDASGTTMEDHRLGGDNARRAYAFADLLRRGARLAGSSDHFGNLPGPMASLRAAVTRSGPDGLPAGGWNPEQRLTVDQALTLLCNAWPAGGGEPQPGTLRPGARADLVALSADPRTAGEAQRLEAIRVLGTWRAGRRTAP